MKRPLYPVHLPALLPALGFLLGTAFALQAKTLGWPWAVLLFVLALFLRRHRAAHCLAFVALGWLGVQAHDAVPNGEERSIDRQRPVTAVVDVEGPWRVGAFGWSVPVRVKELEQGDRIVRWREPLWLRLSGLDSSPPRARTLRVRGFLGRNRGYLNLPPIPPAPWSLKVKSLRLVEVVAPPGFLMSLSQRLREKVAQSIQRASEGVVGSASLPWLKALVLGDAGDISDADRRILRRTGLAHLLAVSGLHVGLVALAILIFTHRAPRGIRLATTALGVSVYLLLIGPRPAVLRATFMALLAVASLLLRRPPLAANGLALFVLAAAAWRPQLVLDLGFQLSVAATGGIVLLTPWLSQSWTPLPGWVGPSLAASLSAQLATLPFAVPAFHLWVPVASLFNLIALPWAAVVLTSFLVWTGLALTAPSVAGELLPALDWLMAPMNGLRKMPASSWMVIPAAVGPGTATAVAIGLAVALRWPRRGGWVLLVLLVVGKCGTPRPTVQPTVTMLDVGQGEAILLRDGPHAVLVDGGGWRSGDFASRVLVPALAGEGIRALDAVLMTHPDEDHCGGLVGLIDYLPVGELWTAPHFEQSDCASSLLARGRPMRALSQGTKLALGSWSLEVLHPRVASPRSNDNEGSVVVRGQVGESCILLTGDIEGRSEAELLRHDPRALQCRFLKIAHHGSKTSSSEAFLDAVAPQVALISAGTGNVYGHPAPAVVDRLRERRVRVFRTDLHGRLHLVFGAGDQGRVSSVAAWPGKRPQEGPRP